MASFEQKDNAGALFVNDRKRGENDPDRKGTVVIDGREMWCSGWIKKSKTGQTYLSLSFRPKEASVQSTDRAKYSLQSKTDEEVPF